MRGCVYLFTVIVLVDAFIPVSSQSKVHTDMVKEALLRVVVKRFMELNLIAAGSNFTVDDKRCIFESVFGGLASMEKYDAAEDEMQVQVADIDAQTATRKNPAWHFDGEHIAEGHRMLQNHFATIVNDITKSDYASARIRMGRAMHRLAAAVANLFTQSEINEDEIYTCTENLLLSDVLTSGYSTGQKDDYGNAVVKPDGWKTTYNEKVGKCSHGGIMDVDSGKQPQGGINKDTLNAAFSPHFYLHEEAAALAIDATEFWIHAIRKAVDDSAKFDAFLKINTQATGEKPNLTEPIHLKCCSVFVQLNVFVSVVSTVMSLRFLM